MKKFKQGLLLVLLIFVVNFTVDGKQNRKQNCFQQIDSYQSVKDVFDACDKHTLVTFDVDDTLITTLTYLASDLYFTKGFMIRAALKYPWLLVNKKKFDWLCSLVSLEAERFVFDPDIVTFIKQIQNQGCSVVALTSILTGPIGVMKSAPIWRANMLNDFGIDLSGQFQDVFFTTLSSYRKSYPCLYKGILCTNKIEKGKVLGAFLDYYQLKPSIIISFDDLEGSLNSIKRECELRKINFTGYQMLGAKKLHKWNTKKALYQLDSVMKKNQLPTNDQVDEFIGVV